jgi:hypothetical protein
VGGTGGFKLSSASKESANGGLGAPGIPIDGDGTGAAGLGACGKTGDGADRGTPAGLRPGAVTDGIFPEISASKMPPAGTGFGGTGTAGEGDGGEGGTNVSAEGGFAPMVKPEIGGKGGRIEPPDGVFPNGGFAPTINPAIGGREATEAGVPAGDGVKVPTGEIVPIGGRIPDAGFLVSDKVGITGLTGESVTLMFGITPGAVGEDFLVEKVKISLVPISAFSAIAVPP